MMHDNGNYFFGGMHMGWWFLILVIVIAIVVWFGRSRNRK